MPRIRTLKPQFWDSPSTAQADLAPRLLFMALWNWADDAGRGTANLKELEAFAFPNDDVTQLPRRSRGNSAPVWRNFAEVFWEAVQAYGVELYEVGGRRFFEISSFRLHQSKNFRPDSTLPAPHDGRKWDLGSEYGFTTPDTDTPVAESPPDCSGNSALSCRTSPLDKDGDRDMDRDWDEEPPYPPERETPTPQRLPARKNGGGLTARQMAVELNKNARSLDAYKIAEAFSSSLPTPIQRNLLAGIGKEIDECLRDGIPPPAIANGLRAWTDSDSFSPTQIPNYVHKANNGSRTNGRGKATEKALGYDAAAEQLIAELGASR